MSARRYAGREMLPKRSPELGREVHIGPPAWQRPEAAGLLRVELVHLEGPRGHLARVRPRRLPPPATRRPVRRTSRGSVRASSPASLAPQPRTCLAAAVPPSG